MKKNNKDKFVSELQQFVAELYVTAMKQGRINAYEDLSVVFEATYPLIDDAHVKAAIDPSVEHCDKNVLYFLLRSVRNHLTIPQRMMDHVCNLVEVEQKQEYSPASSYFRQSMKEALPFSKENLEKLLAKYGYENEKGK